MDDEKKDIKVTITSPLGAGAIGAIQLSGMGAGQILSSFFSKPLTTECGRIQLGYFHDAQGRRIDQVLTVRLPVEQEIYEITSHGGIRIVQRIVETLQEGGAHLTTDEGSAVAIFGLQDFPAHEAYRLLERAKTTLAVKFLLYQAHSADREKMLENRKYWPAVRFLLDGVRIAITGPPNAGKSTLLNAMGRTAQSLVSDFPGTTRDYVEVALDIGGLPVELVDTAGIGSTSDALWETVQLRSLDQVRRADVIFLMLDATDRTRSLQFLQRLCPILDESKRVVVLVNKIDTGCEEFPLPESWPVLRISALRETNLARIPEIVWRVLDLDGFDYREPMVFSEKLVTMC